MSHIFALANLLKITNKSFFNSLKFLLVFHIDMRFLKKKNCTFINDSKATSFQSNEICIKKYKKYLLDFGGLPKKKKIKLFKTCKKKYKLKHI